MVWGFFRDFFRGDLRFIHHMIYEYTYIHIYIYDVNKKTHTHMIYGVDKEEAWPRKRRMEKCRRRSKTWMREDVRTC